MMKIIFLLLAIVTILIIAYYKYKKRSKVMVYEDEILKIINNTDIPQADIFNYRETPKESDFEGTFQFYRGILTWAKRFGITSSYIYFQNDFSRNARAKTYEGKGIIGITSGLMMYQIENFLNRSDIDEKLSERFRIIIPFLDNPIHVLMYQQIQHSTFYHELGHLIQLSNSNETMQWWEENNTDNNFSLIRHKLEMDADSFSAIAVATHIQQYGLKIFGEEIDSQKMELLVELFSTTVLLYFLSFSGADTNIYFEQKSHPHPLIRILNVLLIISDYLGQSSALINRGINIVPINLVQRVIELAEKIETEILDKQRDAPLVNSYFNHKTDVLMYFSKLREYPFENYKSAQEEWNKRV